MANEVDIIMDRAKWLLENATKNGDCLECHLSTDKDGYSQVTVQYKNYRAHRLVYKALIAPITAEFILHKCDNRRCINPKHLFKGDPKINYDDMYAKGRRGDNSWTTTALSPNQVEAAAIMYEQGYSQAKIADKFGVNQSTISLALKRWREAHV